MRLVRSGEEVGDASVGRRSTESLDRGEGILRDGSEIEKEGLKLAQFETEESCYLIVEGLCRRKR
jgi:hypothetical protein